MPTRTAEQAARVQRHRVILDEMIDMAADLAQMAHSQAKAQPAAELPGMIDAFDRVTRAMRRCMALSHVLDRPPGPDHAAKRRQILRAVEDVIEERAEPERKAALRAELVERMDAPDIDADITAGDADKIVANVVRDLGLADMPGFRWPRRTPADVARLCARAAGPPALANSGRLECPPCAAPTRLDSS